MESSTQVTEPRWWTPSRNLAVWSLLWGIGINAGLGLAGLLLFGYLRLTSIYSAKLFRPRHLLMVGCCLCFQGRSRHGCHRESSYGLLWHVIGILSQSVWWSDFYRCVAVQELQARERERDVAMNQDATTISQLKKLSQELPTKVRLGNTRVQLTGDRLLTLHLPSRRCFRNCQLGAGLSSCSRSLTRILRRSRGSIRWCSFAFTRFVR